MIEEIKDITLINDLFKEYKEKYNPIINDYTFVYSYKFPLCRLGRLCC